MSGMSESASAQTGPASPSGPLPAPTGRYPVGRAMYIWHEAPGEAPPAGSGRGPRELVVWVWYPAAPEPGARPASYLPAGWEAVGQFWGFRAEGAFSHAFADAPVASDRATYPVLVFSPAGYPPLSLAAILEEVASHGYVVAG